MREFKFRVWTGKMRYFDFQDIYGGEFDDCSHIFGNPIMQSVGKKDKNGKELYEGDIIKGKKPVWKKDCPPRGLFHPKEDIDHYIDIYSKIVWNNESVCFCAKGKSGWFSNWEIVGNIYENPELLEEKK